MSLGLSLDIAAASWLGLTLGIGQDFDLSSDKPISLFETADMSYSAVFVFIF